MLINVFIVFEGENYFSRSFPFIPFKHNCIAASNGRREFASYMFAKIKLLLTGFSFDANSNL